jgi:NADH-quinone oxidoreductase subunit G
MTAELVRLTVDGVEVDVPKGTMIVDAAKKAGIDIPVFCYHPKLKPVGMCRMCLVEVGRPTIDRSTGKPVLNAQGAPEVTFNPKLETACTTPVGPGFVVRVMTEKAMLARRQIVEFLLTSHPLDCPVCDKGGECPLQELTMGHGPGESRFLFDEKIRLEKRMALGDLIFLDRERCIQCGRCVRFQEEIVDDPVIGFYERGRRLEIVTFSDPGFDSYFSGNTTDICPVGALTTADFRFGARAWELNASASICPHCPVGCNLTLNTRREARASGREVIKRVMPRQNEAVNEIWICDKGRFGHHFAASPERLTTPLIRKDGQLVEATWDEALDRAAEGLRKAGGSLLGLAGGQLTNEDFFLLRRLVEGVGGKAALFEEMGGGEVVSQFGPTQGTELGSLGAGDAVVAVACDLHEEAPIWWLRVKQAAERGAKVIVMNARATRLEDIATHVVRYPMGHAARAGLGLLMALEKGDGAAFMNHEAAYRVAADAIKSASRVVIFFGSEGLDREGSESLARTCANLLVATGHTGKVDSALIPVWPHANSQGAWDMGLRPLGKHLPQEVGQAAALYVTACDPAGDDAQLERLFLAGKFLLVQELFMTRTASLADVVLPAQSWAEREGTYTTGLRRVQRFYPALPHMGQSRPDGSIMAELGRRLGLTMESASPAEVMRQLAATVEDYAGVSYQSLAVVEPQWPVVGDEDLYYGGTSYKNKQGTGVQLSRPESETALLEVTAEQPPSAVKPNQFLLVPITRLLAPSTTLAASEVLRARMVLRRVSLNPEDAMRLGIQPGAVVELRWNGESGQIPVHLDSAVPPGVAWMPRNTGTPLLSPAVAEILVPEPAGRW